MQVVTAVADALREAHAATDQAGRPLHLVHRDIKPANIRLGVDGGVKVLDFGIAKAGLEGREARTKTHMLIGSLEYMAPERFDHDADGDLPAGDVFSLGCVLYEGITGKVLFARSSVKKQLTLAMDADRHTVWTGSRIMRLQGAPPALLDLLRRMLAHDPAERPTASQVVEGCEALSRDLEGESLLQWARAREWPKPGVVEPSDLDGPLVGRSITEGARPVGATFEELEAPTPDLEPTPPSPAGSDAPAPPRRTGLWLLGGGLVAGIAVAVCLAGGGLAAAVAGWALLTGP